MMDAAEIAPDGIAAVTEVEIVAAEETEAEIAGVTVEVVTDPPEIVVHVPISRSRLLPRRQLKSKTTTIRPKCGSARAVKHVATGNEKRQSKKFGCRFCRKVFSESFPLTVV